MFTSLKLQTEEYAKFKGFTVSGCRCL